MAKRKRSRSLAKKSSPSGNVRAVLSFFSNAGIRAELAGGIWINGKRAELRATGQPDTLVWRKRVDEIALTYAGEKFSAMVAANARFGEGLRVVPRWSEHGVAIMRADLQ